ncbi:hypothetical protein K470DRAFT_216319 [Piedraia hortae CBS 480.64]|uniref:Uncharacterized protein n=1 Tax=Piedraia hortae CBS 480.64 TaxID=1314780 RepID=A0A6A7C2C0_9PEZI|nr:hypothetical protein K470DRAFT_216319 [Piedraia hortae CBS 480.64]
MDSSADQSTPSLNRTPTKAPKLQPANRTEPKASIQPDKGSELGPLGSPQSTNSLDFVRRIRPAKTFQAQDAEKSVEAQKAKKAAETVENAEKYQDLSELPIDIRPPEPNSTATKFITHVTSSLDLLVRNEQLSDIYKPVNVARRPRLLERGHWLMVSDGWPPKLQCQFWLFLVNFVGQGKAGWGVWCRRETQSSSDLGTVKVYCWGELVRHIYLLLYVASNSKVKKLGLKWVDAEGKVVVEMQSAS